MKWILVALMSVSFASTAFAQLKPNFMTHEEAIRLSLAEPLKFIGQYIPDGSIHRKPGCLLRNRYVTIAYSYCYPQEIQALSIRVYSADVTRGSVRIYAEIENGAVSKALRSEYYDVLWYTSVTPQVAGYSHKLDSVQYEAFEPSLKNTDYCIISFTNDTTAPTALCSQGIHGSVVQKFGPPAISFWREPSSNWYKLQKSMRQVIESSLKN